MTNDLFSHPLADNLLFWLSMFLIVFIGAIMWLLPRLSNASLFFAVTVEPDFRDSSEGRAIMARYQRQIFWFSVILLILTLAAALAAGPSPQRRATIGLISQQIAVWGLIIGSFVFYLQARRRVLPHAAQPSPIREASLRPPRPRYRLLFNILSIGPFILLAGCAIYLHQHWAEVPAHFPIHWGISGRPDGWASKTPRAVAAPLIIGTVMAGFILLINLAIRHTPRKYASGPLAEREERIRLGTEFLMIGIAYSMVLTFAPLSVWLPFRKVTTLPPGYLVLSLGSTFGIVIIALGYIAWAASRRDGETVPVGDRTPDQCWKWGMIYYNPDDPAIMVEKRFGIGWTLNFGRPMAWFVLALLLSPVLITFLVLGIKSK